MLAANLPKARLVTITPAMAEKWLEKLNHGNKPIKQKHVDLYAYEMKRGKWKLNGDTIKIGHTRLLDGQHRLWACVISGKEFTAYVVEGLDDEVFDTIDVGIPKTGGDLIFLSGSGTKKYQNECAAVCRLCISYLKGNVRQHLALPRHEISDYFAKNQQILDYVTKVKSGKGWVKAYTAPAAAIAYLGSHESQDDADEFLHKFTTGEGLTAKSPILQLRNRLGTEKNMTKSDRFGLFINAWNAFKQGREVSKLQIPRGEFPKIIGARK